MTHDFTFRRRGPGWRAGLLVPAALAVASCRGPAPEPVADPAPGAAPTHSISISDAALAAEGIAVAAAATERRSGFFEVPAVFQLDETRTSRVGAIAEGVVVDADVQAGSRVAKGTRLAGIHSHMVHDAWAGYRRALAEKRRATTELAFATDTEHRTQRLLETKAVSRQEAERARTERAAAEEALVIADSELLRALAELEHLGIAANPDTLADPVDDVPIAAAYAGVVLERLVTNGTAVTVGSPMFVVSDLSRLWAVAEVDETRLPALSVGRTVDLVVSAYPERSFTGRIIAIGDAVSPETRRVTARIEVANQDGSLKPQMFATVRVPFGDERDVVVVPAGAVQKFEAEPVVFVRGAAGEFVRRPVTVGAERNGTIEIVDGLKAGERIATTGTFLIKSKFLDTGAPE